MNDALTTEELLARGFREVGKGVQVSRDARFFGVDGVLGDEVRIDAFAILTGRIRLHAGVHISPFSFLSGAGGVIEMHPGSGVASRVTIYTKSADYTGSEVSASKKVAGDVSIGENSIVGTGSTIMPGVSIGPNVSIATNSVVTKDIEAGSIVINRGLQLVTVGRRES